VGLARTDTSLHGSAVAVVLHLGVLAGSTQTNIYLFSGSETNITLNPDTYIITVYGAPGGGWEHSSIGSLGAEMSAEFNFSTPTNLTLLVGGNGDIAATFYTYNGGGGGGGSFVVEGSTPLVVAGGGGGGVFNGLGFTDGGNATITTYGSAGGGNNGGSRGGGGGGGTGGDAMLTGFGNTGDGAAGGGGFYTDGTGGRSIFGYTLPAGGSPLPLDASAGGGGLSFEDGGAGGLSNSGTPVSGDGGFGGGGGGCSDNNYGFGGGGGGGYSGGGGGGGNSPDGGYGGGGGGGSFIDSFAIAILAEGPGLAGPPLISIHGEIIITALPPPLAITADAAFGFTNGVFGFNLIGPSGSNVVIQASADLQTWIPLQTNLLSSGLLYFSDPQSPTNVQRFYRAQLLP
jgi:hypothetical protein